MNELQLSALPQRGMSGGVKRDIRSTAGDGFKALFHNIIQSGSGQGSNSPDSVSAISPFEGDGDTSTPLDTLPKEILEKISQEISKDSRADTDPTLEQTIDKLLSSAETLGEEDVDNLVKEIKGMLKDPKVASQILKVLEEAGVDLSTLNQLDLRKALEALPLNVREQLANLLTTDKAQPTPDTVTKALSEALGQLLQEQREPKAKGDQPKASSEEGDSLDKFLVRSKARVVAAPVEESLNKEMANESLRQERGVVSSGKESSQNAAVEPLLQETAVQTAEPQSGAGLTVAAMTEAKALQVADGSTVANVGKGREDGISTMDPNRAGKAKKQVANFTMASTNQSTDVEKNNILKRLMAQARLHLKDGEGKFQIRLDPPELGNIRLTIENKEGVLSASISTESDAAKQTLLVSLDSLKAALSDQGVNVGEINVFTANSQNRGQGGQSQQQLERQMQEHQSKMVVAADRRRDEEDDVIYEEELNHLNVEV